MTTDQRFREERRQLWRETQRQLNELAFRVNDLSGKIGKTNESIYRFVAESRAADQELRIADQRLQSRVDSLVFAIAELIRSKS